MKKFVVCGLSVCLAGVFGAPPFKGVSNGFQGNETQLSGNGISNSKKHPLNSEEMKRIIKKLKQDNNALKRRFKEKDEENKAIKEGNRNLVTQNEVLSETVSNLKQQCLELSQYCESDSSEKEKINSYIRSVVMPARGNNEGACLNAVSTYCRDQIEGSSDQVMVQNGEYSELFNDRKHNEIRSYLDNYRDKDVPMNVSSQFVQFAFDVFRQGFNFLYNRLEENNEKVEKLSEDNRQLARQSQEQQETLLLLGAQSQRQYEELLREIQRLSSENNKLKETINNWGFMGSGAAKMSVPRKASTSTNVAQSFVSNVPVDVPYDVVADGRSLVRNENLSFSVKGNFVDGYLDFSKDISIYWKDDNFIFRFNGQDDGSLRISVSELLNAAWMNCLDMRGSKHLCLKMRTRSDGNGIVFGRDFSYKGRVVESGKPSGEGVMFLSTGEKRSGEFSLVDWLK